VWTSKKIGASSDLVHGAAKRPGASADDVDATGHGACVTENNVAGTIESAGATEKSEQ
jgi:hypothetical protein